MALPSGNFNSASSGRLQVVFSGQFWTNAGIDFGTGTASLLIRCKVGSGGDLRTAILSLSAGTASAVIERDYVGGSGDVPVEMEFVSYSFPAGPASLGFKEARIACYLIKR